MHAIKLICLFIFTASSAFGQGPSNFAANYLDAKDKAQQSKKICAVIFTEDNNKSAAYTTAECLADAGVKKELTQSYIGVISNVNDFDGKILMKRWQLTKAPSIALVNSTGKVVASVNHGLSKTKMAEFLKFYSQQANAGKSIDLKDDAFIAEVNQWQGYKGQIEEAPIAEAEIEEEQIPAEVKPTPTAVAQQEVKPVIQKSETKVVEEEYIRKPIAEPQESKPVAQKEVIKPEPPVEEVIVSRAPAKPADSYKWLVQAGVFSSEANARSLASKIDANGGKGTVEVINQGDKNVYKVIAGKFYTESQARDFIAKLGGAGIQAFIKEIN